MAPWLLLRWAEKRSGDQLWVEGWLTPYCYLPEEHPEVSRILHWILASQGIVMVHVSGEKGMVYFGLQTELDL